MRMSDWSSDVCSSVLRNGDPRGLIVAVVEHAHLPRPLFFRAGFKAWREAVDRDDQRRGVFLHQSCKRSMIGAVIADEAILPPLRTERCIARNRDAVADMGDKAGRVLLPDEIYAETGQPCNTGGRLQPRRKQADRKSAV